MSNTCCTASWPFCEMTKGPFAHIASRSLFQPCILPHFTPTGGSNKSSMDVGSQFRLFRHADGGQFMTNARPVANASMKPPMTLFSRFPRPCRFAITTTDLPPPWYTVCLL